VNFKFLASRSGLPAYPVKKIEELNAHFAFQLRHRAIGRNARVRSAVAVGADVGEGGVDGHGLGDKKFQGQCFSENILAAVVIDERLHISAHRDSGLASATAHIGFLFW